MITPYRRFGIVGLFVVTVVALLTFAYVTFPYRRLDILITNGMVVDGLGGVPRRVDIAICDGKIVAMGKWRFLLSQPKLRIEARNRHVVPGWIDVHAHVESNLPSSSPFRPSNFLRQGITTLITGNCGRSRTDVDQLFRQLEGTGTFINFATLVGHNSVREAVLGLASRNPAPEELARMQKLVQRAMRSGALGLSSGLAYVPGRFASRSELVALATTAAQEGGIYASHVRDEGRGGTEAIMEALETARQARARSHISHFKSSSPLQWHSMSRRLQLLDTARSSGQEITVDVYPYDRSSTTLDILLPGWALVNNRSEMRKARKDVAKRRRLHVDIRRRLEQEGWTDLSHIQIASGRPEWIGQSLSELKRESAAINGSVARPDASVLDMQIETLIDVCLRGGAQAVYADMDEADVDLAVTYPFSVFGTDSSVRDPSGPYRPHPRGFGTFPRVFRRYVRERELLTLVQAVRKASTQAAQIFNLDNRGVIRPGSWADIVIFDLSSIEDHANYEDPFAEPTGIDYVIVNGKVTVDHGSMTGRNPAGMVLKLKAQTTQTTTGKPE